MLQVGIRPEADDLHESQVPGETWKPLRVQGEHALKREYYEGKCHLENVDNECSKEVFFPVHAASWIYADDSIDSFFDGIENLV